MSNEYFTCDSEVSPMTTDKLRPASGMTLVKGQIARYDIVVRSYQKFR